jgi:glycerol-3-phosphate cytidylyltransferase
MKLGIIAGNFDVLHPGYIYMFKEASHNCDHLLVALHSDPSIERPEKTPPILSLEDRMESLLSIRFIDEIVPYDYEVDLEKLIKSRKPQVRFLGDDYKTRTDYTGFGFCPSVYFFDRSHGWSSTKFKELIYNQVKEKK